MNGKKSPPPIPPKRKESELKQDVESPLPRRMPPPLPSQNDKPTDKSTTDTKPRVTSIEKAKQVVGTVVEQDVNIEKREPLNEEIRKTQGFRGFSFKNIFKKKEVV